MECSKLVTITPDIEKLIAYCARVSSPKNQHNQQIKGLLSYCIRNSHWSPFEMGNMVIEIQTSRAISAQILRHKSFSFQEFSQRYSEVHAAKMYKARRQDSVNRQNSLDDLEEETIKWFEEAQVEVQDCSFKLYDEALRKGIAKEQARFLLPMSSATTIYMNGTIRSWIHYINLRADPAHGTQKEHLEIAQEIKEIFKKEMPTISSALEW